MLKELEQIQKQSTAIMGDYPEQRAELLKKVEDATVDREQAKAAMDNAEDLASYDDAAEAVKRAEMALRFAKAAVDKLEAAPRMDEGEYLKALATCKKIMDKAASSYRTRAAALMDELKTVTDEYIQTAADTNDTLIKLDSAANVLQAKHPYKILHFVGQPDRKIPNRDAWLEYAVRYEPYTAARLATACNPETAEPGKSQDSILTAAWRAIQDGYPRRTF